MDVSESTKIVYYRIHEIEPENVFKILGYLLLQDQGGQDMIRLAFSPDNVIHSLIDKAKIHLGLSSKPPGISPVSPSQSFIPFSPISSRTFSTPSTLPNLDLVPQNYSGHLPDEYGLQFLSLEDQLESVTPVGSDFSSNYYYPEPALGLRTSRRSPSLPEFPVKVCHYFSKGFCKHGSNCRYFHGNPMPESFSHMFNASSNETSSEDVFSPGSLEKLELEITELLRSKRGFPVSIASLPMMYYEKYGKTLQAEGYLTESQRHGKAGYSLTKLLARLKNSIRLIDSYRPHGQHSVILAEDSPKYMGYNGERNEHGGIVAGSRQIYLTFPAESTFTEQDVSNYFQNFGPVQDVRIPCQQKRMFGFVTFLSAESVKHILAKGNPHFVCGARVLVKPYREKSRTYERKYLEKFQHSSCYSSQFFDAEAELHSMPRVCDNSRSRGKQIMEEHDEALGFEKRRLSELEIAAKPLNYHSYFGYSIDVLKRSEGLNFAVDKHREQTEFPSAERYNHILDVLDDGSTSEDKDDTNLNTNNSNQDSSRGINLPDSPFASPVVTSGTSTVCK